MEYPKMPQMIPGLSVSNPGQTFEFFEKLGFHKLYSMEDDQGRLMHGHVARGDSHFMLWPNMENRPLGGSGVVFYINVGGEDLDAFCGQVKDKGVKIVDGPEDQFWGDRTFDVRHPDGYLFTFAKTVKQLSPDDMKAAAQKAMAGVK